MPNTMPPLSLALFLASTLSRILFGTHAPCRTLFGTHSISHSIWHALYLALFSARTLSRILFGTHFISHSIRHALYLTFYSARTLLGTHSTRHALYSARTPCCTLFGTHSISHSLARTLSRNLFVKYSISRGGSKNFLKGGLYTILITFNANDVEVEWRPRASGGRGLEPCSSPPLPFPPPPHAKKSFRFFHLMRHLQNSWDLRLCRYYTKSGVYLIFQQ